MHEQRFIMTDWYAQYRALIKLITLAHTGMEIAQIENEPQPVGQTEYALNAVSAPMLVREEEAHARR